VTDHPRIIISLPDPTESATVAEWLLAEGYEPVRRPTLQAAADEMRDRSFALLIVDAGYALKRGLHPPRNAPTIIIGDAGPGPQAESISGQTVYLPRPVDRAMLGCFVSMAIIDERPARRSTRKPLNRFDAVVNGVPSHILDVSFEGLRLEVASARKAALPPYFTVRVPLVGVAVTVQRMWTRSSPKRAAIWYGGALSQNRFAANEAWRRFVDTVPSSDKSVELS